MADVRHGESSTQNANGGSSTKKNKDAKKKISSLQKETENFEHELHELYSYQ